MSREAAAIEAARLVVSSAQGEYEALEQERKRELGDDAEEGRATKRVKQDDDDMEIEMEDDEDGKLASRVY